MSETDKAVLSRAHRCLRLYVPGKRAGTEDSGIRVFQSRDEQFDFVLPQWHHIVIQCFLDRIHNPVTGFGQTAKQDDSLRSRECHKVSQFLAEHLTREIEDLLGDFVTCLGSFEYIVGSDVLELAQRCLFR